MLAARKVPTPGRPVRWLSVFACLTVLRSVQSKSACSTEAMRCGRIEARSIRVNVDDEDDEMPLLQTTVAAVVRRPRQTSEREARNSPAAQNGQASERGVHLDAVALFQSDVTKRQHAAASSAAGSAGRSPGTAHRYREGEPGQVHSAGKRAVGATVPARQDDMMAERPEVETALADGSSTSTMAAQNRILPHVSSEAGILEKHRPDAGRANAIDTEAAPDQQEQQQQQRQAQQQQHEQPVVAPSLELALVAEERVFGEAAGLADLEKQTGPLSADALAAQKPDPIADSGLQRAEDLHATASAEPFPENLDEQDTLGKSGWAVAAEQQAATTATAAADFEISEEAAALPDSGLADAVPRNFDKTIILPFGPPAATQIESRQAFGTLGKPTITNMQLADNEAFAPAWGRRRKP